MRRPAAVTVFGILNIVFAALGLCGTLLALAGLFVEAEGPLAELDREPFWRAWCVIGVVGGLAMEAALLAAGIGLLNLRRWARLTSIYYAIVALVWGAIGLVVVFTFLIPKLARHMGDPAAVGGVIGGVAGGCIGLVYPVLLLIFMTRPRVVQAFERAAQMPPQQDYYLPPQGQ